MPPMTRPLATAPARHRRRGRFAAVGAGLALALVVPAIALAHPLGNFTINHYAGIRVEPTRVILDVVIDQAEIPTFQERIRIDTDLDGSVSDEEAEAERLAACPVLARSLVLSAGGTVLPLVPVEAGLAFPAGAAGLETMRLACTYAASLPHPLAPGTAFSFKDTSHAERLGWREIVVIGSEVTIAGTLPTGSRSGRLTAYPQDLLTQPLDMRSAAFSASPGGARLDPLNVPDASPLPGAPPLYATVNDDATGAGDESAAAASRADSAKESAGAPSAVAGLGVAPGRIPASAPTGAAGSVGAVPGGVGSEVSSLLQTRDLTPFVLLGSLLAAMALGAGHALTPGHGKTLMGAYLVGTRGTAVHAVALGLSVTVSHTMGILVLAAIVVAMRGVIAPDAFNRFAPIASGLIVIGIGGWMLVSQARARRSSHPDGPSEAAIHDHDHDGMHSHGGVSHSHLPSAGTKVGWRSLFVLGLAGGIIPSTNALIILLSTIATGRAVYGLILVVAFGLGMAVVLGGVGLGLVFARGRLDGLPSGSGLGRVAGYAPVLAGALVLSLGIYLTTQAVGMTPSL